MMMMMMMMTYSKSVCTDK